MALRPPGATDTPPPLAPSHASPVVTGHPPTDEQAAILDAVPSGEDLVVEALAGSGKTTTLKMIAQLRPHRPGTYLVFNKASQSEAAGKFPMAVNVTTAHSLAYRAVGTRYAHRLPQRGGGSRRVPARVTAERLHIRPASTGLHYLKPEQLVRLAEATIAQFCLSDRTQILPEHLPEHAKHLGPRAEVAAVVLPVADRVWQDIVDPSGGAFFTHSHYLKIWQIGRPRLPVDYVMFDEAQDADPVIAAVVADQGHTQRIYVGDRNQQLYAWRGAVDAMSRLGGRRLSLTRSFRFGPQIAEQANFWLEQLGCELRVVGAGPQGRITAMGGDTGIMPDAFLCRGNGTAIQMVIGLQNANIRVGLAPGDRSAGADIRSFAFAALDLQAGRGTDYHELSAFRTWHDLLQYIEEEENTSDLKRMVNIIVKVGASRVIDAIKGLAPRESAQIMVSTAHKAKGLEWDRVKVADDFAPPTDPEGNEVAPETAELMLNYVTVTRAKRELDPGSLAPNLWADSLAGFFDLP